MKDRLFFKHKIRELENFITEGNKLLESIRTLYNDIIYEEQKINRTFKDAEGDQLITYKDICTLLQIDEWDFQFRAAFEINNTLTQILVGKATKYKLWEVRKQFEYLKFLKSKS